MKIAIVTVAYNRVLSLQRLLSSLDRADYPTTTTLIISIDKGSTDIVEKCADEFVWKHGEKRVIKHKKNLGLRNHMLSLGKFFDEFDSLIVLEDDVTVAPSFYYYAKQCVEKYSTDESIAGISLYSFQINYQNGLLFSPVITHSDVYLMQCAQSWGEVWMKDSWNRFYCWYQSNSEEFSSLPHLPEAICRWPRSSWLKYHTKYCIEHNKYFVYPYVSLSTNNGDAGTHMDKSSTQFQVDLLRGVKKTFRLDPTVCYDGFFENCDYGFNVDDVCVDLYGEKGNRLNNRYWLTMQHHDYEVVQSYSLKNRPWDINILDNQVGNDIFLYDTTKRYNRERHIVDRFTYLYKRDMSPVSLFKLGIKCFLEGLGICKCK